MPQEDQQDENALDRLGTFPADIVRANPLPGKLRPIKCKNQNRQNDQYHRFSLPFLQYSILFQKEKARQSFPSGFLSGSYFKRALIS